MSSSPDKRLRELYDIPGDCPKELRQSVGFLRQFVNEERSNGELLTSSEVWHFLKKGVDALIQAEVDKALKEERKGLNQLDAALQGLRTVIDAHKEER